MIEVTGGQRGEGLRVGIVASRFNELVGERLVAGAVDALRAMGVADADVVLARVPGALEIPFAARALAEHGGVDAVIALGCVIRGQTAHFDVVAGQSAAGVAHVALSSGVPVLNGILTTDSLEQALDRAGGKAGNKGRDCAAAAVQMARLGAAIRRLGPDAARAVAP